MLFLNDTVSLQNSKIVSKIFSQHARDGITSYLNLFGDLYYGHLQPDIFMARHNGLKKEFIARLVNDGPDVAHNLCMIELTQRESWRWPAPLTELSTGLLWSAGNSRTVATGLVHTDPWTRLPVLILLHRGTDPGKYLSTATRINTDEELHTALGVTYKVGGDYYHPELEIQATLADDSGRPAMLLKYVGNKEAELDYAQVGEVKLQEYKDWRNRYGVSPTIHVYTDTPECVVNTVWNVVNAGPLPDREHLYLPGNLEEIVLGQKIKHDHAVYIAGTRTVNLDELLPWVNLEYTTYIDKNWDFILHRHDQAQKSKFISVTQDK